MYYAAIGGMQLKRWMGWFLIIMPTLRVLNAAKKADGCVHADMFKLGKVYYAVSVWNDIKQMQGFAHSGLHGKLMRIGFSEMALFYNHTQQFDSVPSRDQMDAAWHAAMAKRDGKGTVGAYSA